ncbi:MAG: M23 family metallopeptidase [Novosphingobium sp.]|nr:M23 family metallopeptidase [Novosphingobium sp.]
MTARRWAALALLLTTAAKPHASAQHHPAKPPAHPAKPTKPEATESPAAARPEEESEHVVQPGETLLGIAHRAKVPRVLIIEANGLTPPYKVETGERLVIPRTRHHTVAKGETGFAIAYRYGVSWQAIAVANGLDSDKPLKPGQKLLIPTLIKPEAVTQEPEPAAAPPPSPAAEAPTARFAWPLEGDMVQAFTRHGKPAHDGVDIAAREGDPVRAAAAGRVIFAGREPQRYGNLVVIDHGDGWTSAYGHLQRTTVREGERVRSGERIGLAGHSGRATRDAVHFELRRNNRPVDPTAELPEHDSAPDVQATEPDKRAAGHPQVRHPKAQKTRPIAR